MRRSLLAGLAVLALLISLAGCGGSSRGGGRVINGAICAYSAYRAVHDFRHHHPFFGAFNAYLALHHCPRAFRRRY